MMREEPVRVSDDAESSPTLGPWRRGLEDTWVTTLLRHNRTPYGRRATGVDPSGWRVIFLWGTWGKEGYRLQGSTAPKMRTLALSPIRRCHTRSNGFLQVVVRNGEW